MESKGYQKTNVSSVEIKKKAKCMDFMYKDLRRNVWDVAVSCEARRRLVMFKITNEETGLFWKFAFLYQTARRHILEEHNPDSLSL